jgi:hypothetical protein
MVMKNDGWRSANSGKWLGLLLLLSQQLSESLGIPKMLSTRHATWAEIKNASCNLVEISVIYLW